MPSALTNLSDRRQKVVRKKVQELLRQSPSFRSLDPIERRRMANALVNVVAYLSDPNAGQAGSPTEGTDGAPPFALAQAKRQKQKIVQEDFTAAAGTEGAAIFERLTQAVDFPEFVAGLIDGVFNSIVDASIRQMEAYGKLLESVVKSVDEFAKDNFTANQGRDWLVNRFPSSLKLDVQNGNPRVQLRSEASDNDLEAIQNELGVQGELDLSDEESEAALAGRARLEMARLRQKQLATMVLLGINRIVVTDGLINAKVIIDVKTSDAATRINRASSYDDAATQYRRKSGGGWFSNTTTETAAQTRTIVTSAMDETSESKADAKAKLSGEVRVNFKSETFPLERLASQTQLDNLSQTAKPGS